MNRIFLIFLLFFISYSIRAAIQIEIFGLFLGPDDTRQQWIEVKNHSTSSVDVSGFILQLEDEELYRFPIGTILKPQEVARINFVDSSNRISLGDTRYVVREKRLFTGRVYSSKESDNFIKLYENFRTLDEKKRRKFYANLLPVLERVPTVLERIYVKTKNGEVEDAVLVTTIYIDKHDGFRLADLGRVGLMPVTFLVSRGENFENRQALVLPSEFSVKTFRLGNKKLLIHIQPYYLMAEPQAEVEVYFYSDENMSDLLWSKTAPVRTGSGILISAGDAEILKSIKSEKIYFKMILRAKDYQSEQITGSADFYIMDSAKD